MGAVPPATDAEFITAFPNFNMTSSTDKTPLGFLTWGGCQVQDPVFGNWTGQDNSDHFDGKTTGEPLVLHTLSPAGTMLPGAYITYITVLQPHPISGVLLIYHLTTNRSRTQCEIQTSTNGLESLRGKKRRVMWYARV